MKNLYFAGAALVAAWGPMEDTIIIEPEEDHTHTVVFLHGLEESAESYAQEFEEDGLFYHPNRKAVLPSAPIAWNDALNGEESSWWNFERFPGPLLPFGIGRYFWNSDNYRYLMQLLSLNFCELTKSFPQLAD